MKEQLQYEEAPKMQFVLCVAFSSHTYMNMEKKTCLKNNLLTGQYDQSGMKVTWSCLQAIRTVALRLLEVPKWLQATHRHQ